MKTICFLFLATILFCSCDKNNESKEAITQDDLTASVSMTSELSSMRLSLSNLTAAQSYDQQHYWDSAYHYHDSLFWYHHDDYHHNTYTHDDHGHQWVPYDPAVNHHHHFHHPYPGHLSDSLTTTPNNHHHNNNDQHHSGHDLNHHQLLDSLHQVHNSHHP